MMIYRLLSLGVRRNGRSPPINVSAESRSRFAPGSNRTLGMDMHFLVVMSNEWGKSRLCLTPCVDEKERLCNQGKSEAPSSPAYDVMVIITCTVMRGRGEFVTIGRVCSVGDPFLSKPQENKILQDGASSSNNFFYFYDVHYFHDINVTLRHGGDSEGLGRAIWAARWGSGVQRHLAAPLSESRGGGRIKGLRMLSPSAHGEVNKPQPQQEHQLLHDLTNIYGVVWRT